MQGEELFIWELEGIIKIISGSGGNFSEIGRLDYLLQGYELLNGELAGIKKLGFQFQGNLEIYCRVKSYLVGS